MPQRPDLGVMYTPGMSNPFPAATAWAADNGCFAAGERFDAKRWLMWLSALPFSRSDCLFAVAPDVVGDAAATLQRSAPFLPILRGLGVPVAFVGQDGQEDLPLPWDQFDCLFLGGTTEWKLSEAAYDLVRQAKARGKWVHQGRCNSFRRLRAAYCAGIDSADGTFVKFGPDKNLPRLLGWLDAINRQPTLLTEAR